MKNHKGDIIKKVRKHILFLFFFGGEGFESDKYIISCFFSPATSPRKNYKNLRPDYILWIENKTEEEIHPENFG